MFKNYKQNCNSLTLKIYLSFISLFIGLKIHAYDLPDIGNQSQYTLSYQDERLLGESIYQDIQKQLPIITNSFIENYIQKLGTKLVSKSNKYFDYFEFFVVNSPEINAFALPGGYIGVNRGLITTADNESELAAVLAHEITHVNQRHIARSIEKQQQMQLPMLAGILAGALISAYSPEAGQSIIAGSMAAGHQSLINYTRDNEEEADRIGMEVLTTSGYSPYSMGNFFSKMQRNLYADNDNFPEYLRTHPVNSSRITDANSRADKLILNAEKYKHNQPDLNEDLDFALVKNILLIDNTQNLQNIINTNKSAISNSNHNKLQNNLHEFNIAYALLKKEDLEQANIILQKLAVEYPKNNLIIGLYAETMKKEYKAALNILNKQLQLATDNIPLIIQYAKLAINNGMNDDAIKILKRSTMNNNHYPAIINLLLAESYNNLNQKWQASMAYSDYSVQKGDLAAAIMQLKATEKFEKLTGYQQKIVQYRLKNLEAKHKERKERLKAWT